MSYSNRSIFRATLLAASAAALMAVTAPAAFAAPQNGSNADKTVQVKIAQNHSRDRSNSRNSQSNNRGNSRSNTRGQTRRDTNTRSHRDRSSNTRQHGRNNASRHGSSRHQTSTRPSSRRHTSYGNNHRTQHRPYASPAPRYTRPVRHVSNNRRHNTSYRSGLGISFNFGNSGYSRHRWAPTAYSFYQPSYGQYGNYQRRTRCQRINLDAWRYGQPVIVSVRQCSNPWSGTYIVQGSERIVAQRW